MGKKQKPATALGEGISVMIGFIFGLALLLVLYGWYLTGYADTTTVMTTAIILILLIFIIDWLIVIVAKKFQKDYEKGVAFGMGFLIAVIICAFVLGIFGYASPISLGG